MDTDDTWTSSTATGQYNGMAGVSFPLLGRNQLYLYQMKFMSIIMGKDHLHHYEFPKAGK